MNSSMELNWIRKFDKSLINPTVVFSSLKWASGLYYHPEKDEICIDGKFYHLGCGLIEVSNFNNETAKETAGTIAHEWRHHWQYFNLPKEKVGFEWPKSYNELEYNEMIVKYFTLNPLEMDALRFQKRYSYVYENWEEILQNYLC